MNINMESSSLVSSPSSASSPSSSIGLNMRAAQYARPPLRSGLVMQHSQYPQHQAANNNNHHHHHQQHQHHTYSNNTSSMHQGGRSSMSYANTNNINLSSNRSSFNSGAAPTQSQYNSNHNNAFSNVHYLKQVSPSPPPHSQYVSQQHSHSHHHDFHGSLDPSSSSSALVSASASPSLSSASSGPLTYAVAVSSSSSSSSSSSVSSFSSPPHHLGSPSQDDSAAQFYDDHTQGEYEFITSSASKPDKLPNSNDNSNTATNNESNTNHLTMGSTSLKSASPLSIAAPVHPAPVTAASSSSSLANSSLSSSSVSSSSSSPLSSLSSLEQALPRSSPGIVVGHPPPPRVVSDVNVSEAGDRPIAYPNRPNNPHESPGDGSDLASSCLWVGNVCPSVLKSDFRAAFEVFGEVLLIRSFPKSKCAFVTFKSVASAVSALALEGTQLGSMKLTLNLGKASRHLWLGNVGPEVGEADVRNEFGGFGPIESIRLLRQNQCAFVNFVDALDAWRAANKMNGNLLGNNKLVINFQWTNATKRPNPPAPTPPPLPPGASRSSSGSPGADSHDPQSINSDERDGFPSYMFPPHQPVHVAKKGQSKGRRDAGDFSGRPSRQLFVGNLVPSVTEETLWALFSRFGELEQIKGFASRGYAFVIYRSLRVASWVRDQMITFPPILGGRALAVNFGRPPADDGARILEEDDFLAGAEASANARHAHDLAAHGASVHSHSHSHHASHAATHSAHLMGAQHHDVHSAVSAASHHPSSSSAFRSSVSLNGGRSSLSSLHLSSDESRPLSPPSMPLSPDAYSSSLYNHTSSAQGYAALAHSHLTHASASHHSFQFSAPSSSITSSHSAHHSLHPAATSHSSEYPNYHHLVGEDGVTDHFAGDSAADDDALTLHHYTSPAAAAASSHHTQQHLHPQSHHLHHQQQDSYDMLASPYSFSSSIHSLPGLGPPSPLQATHSLVELGSRGSSASDGMGMSSFRFSNSSLSSSSDTMGLSVPTAEEEFEGPNLLFNPVNTNTQSNRRTPSANTSSTSSNSNTLAHTISSKQPESSA